MDEKNYDLDGSECPMGDDCAIHFRNNEEKLVAEFEGGRIVTYEGDYVIITDDNPDLYSPMIAMKMMLDPNAPMPPRYETAVIRVGEGALADLRELSYDDQEKTVRFTQQHDEWSNFKAAHEMIVDGVKNGILDLATSYKDK